jgi:hypothetical protein
MVDRSQSPLPKDDGAFVIRPLIPLDRYLAFGALLTLIMLAIAGVYWILVTDKLAAVGAGVVVPLFLVLGGIRLLLVSNNSYLRVDADSLVFVNGLRLRRSVRRARVARIYQARFIVGTRSAYTFSYYLFLDRAGETLLKLPGKWWPEDRIEALGSAAGIPVNGTRTVLEGPAFRRAFPGSISWFSAHPVITAILMGPAFFAAFILGLIVLDLIQGKI